MHLLANFPGSQSLIGCLVRKRLISNLIIPVLLSCAIVHAQTTIPDTPAGKVLRAWIEAFNSGDRSKIEDYIKTYDPQQSVERMMGFHSQTGGFDLLASESTDPL